MGSGPTVESPYFILGLASMVGAALAILAAGDDVVIRDGLGRQN
jgi:hypothetical protein